MYKIKEFKQTSTVAPSQWEGVLENGSNFYIRYRNNKFYFEIEGEVIMRSEFLRHDSGDDSYLSEVYMSQEEAFRICGLEVKE